MKARAAKRLHFASYTILVGVLLILAFTIGLLVWPYNNFSYGEPGPLKTQERTSTGLPVVRQGQPVKWDQPFCNHGVPTHSDRWADIYGTPTQAGFVDEKFPMGIRVASFEIPSIKFYGYQDTCETTEVYAIMPNYIAPGAVYRLRIDTSYQPNPIRTITSTISTEPFLLLAPGEPIP